MATQKLNITRDQLATFLGNHELVKQFERLFQVVDEVSPSSDTQGIQVVAESAQASANDALAQLVILARDSAIDSGNADNKAQQALDALNRIANAIEFAVTNPVVQNNNSVATDYIDVNSNAPTAVGGVVGRLKWNDTEGTLDLGLKGGNVTLQIGQENVLLVKNDDTVSLTDGMVVYISGANGANLLVKRALANSDLTSASTIGVVTETLAVNGQGFITTFGTVRGLNTNAFTEGEILYLSPTVAGALTNVKPVAPQHLVTVGYVEKKSGGNGEIFVKVDNGYELDELHNVLITNPVLAGSLLIYDATTGVWKNARLTAGTNISITNGDGSITINSSNPGGTVTSVGLSAPTGFSVANSPVTSSGTIALSFAAGYSLPTTASQLNWDTAYSERRQWDGGSTNLVAATGRTSLGATTVGSNLFTLANPSAIRYLRINADNSVSTLDAATFRTAIGAGTGNGTVTSVATGTGLTGGPITGSGTISFSTVAVGTWAATPSSANLAAAMTDETGSGSLVFATRPSFPNTIGVGGATASASGAGISFPASVSASTDPNTLDDYEEGNWTPVVTSSSGTITTVGAVVGRYTKIGRQVTVWARVAITNNGTGAGYIIIGGLPFIPSSDLTRYTGAGWNESSALMVSCYANNASTDLNCWYYNAAYPLGSGQSIVVSTSYNI